MEINPKKYLIYQITAPTGTAYIGATSLSMNERWRHHKKRALDPKYAHKPFYGAILEFGPEAFSIEILDECLGKDEASRLERKYIAERGLDTLFNVVSGGMDGASQSEIARYFWASLEDKPEEREAYIQRLCEAQQARGPEAHAHLPLRGRKWQKENPREAYKIAMRALRCAKKVNTTTGQKQAMRDEKAARPLKERLLAKHKGVYLSRSRAVTKVWANRSDADRRELGEKIGATLRNTLANDAELKEINRKSIMEARKHIDVSIQGPAASRGIKKFWAEIRKDPERYEAYIEARKKTLAETNAAKKAKRIANEG